MQPLAYRQKPKKLDYYFGQSHLVGTGKPVRRMIENKQICSMILYGPPGIGKTTLAEIIAQEIDAVFHSLSAVTSGVKDIRSVVDDAKKNIDQQTILFLDEIHRFNKSQQDLLLPYVESGLLVLIGATTENPYFAINNALLSRTAVFKLNHLSIDDAVKVINHAIDSDILLIDMEINILDEVKQAIFDLSSGDARKILNILESLVIAKGYSGSIEITLADLKEIMPEKFHLIDNKGDYFYDQLSAFHKSVRGTDPDAALFWLANMIESGCDPVVILRRMLCIASEDIGNADPRAMTIALDAWQSFERLGFPEGILPLSQAATYFASAPKSNAAYMGYKLAKNHIKQLSSIEVPLHLRNIKPAGIPKGEVYKYPHDYPGAYVKQDYRSPELTEKYYHPVNRGLEIKIKHKLDQLHSNLVADTGK